MCDGFRDGEDGCVEHASAQCRRSGNPQECGRSLSARAGR